MKLVTIRHLWGLQGMFQQFAPGLKAAGYGGIEVHPASLPEPSLYQSVVEPLGLEFIAQIHTHGHSVHEHLRSLREQVDLAVRYSAVLINAHSGRDAFTREEACLYFREAAKIAQDCGVALAHETHRGRILFNPWVTRDLLMEFPELLLTCDYSHWVCVAERLLEDCGEILQLTAERCVYLHARVGHTQGPQVADPRAPEVSAELHAHEGWWDAIWASQEARGLQISYLAPEFGPAPYLQELPYTRQPVANLPEICDWMAQRQQQRFAARMGAKMQQAS